MPRALCLLVFVSLLGCLGQAGAQTSAPLRVGIYANAPKVFMNEDDQPAGILVELLREMASAERWTLEFVPCEWPGCLDLLAAGRIDLLPDVAWSEGRARAFAFHRIPALHSWSQIYAPPGNAIRSLPALKGKRVAVLAGSVQAQNLPAVLEGYDATVTLLPVGSLERAFAMAARGE
nr:diguanylate cyclase [Massilia sp.]